MEWLRLFKVLSTEPCRETSPSPEGFQAWGQPSWGVPTPRSWNYWVHGCMVGESCAGCSQHLWAQRQGGEVWVELLYWDVSHVSQPFKLNRSVVFSIFIESCYYTIPTISFRTLSSPPTQKQVPYPSDITLPSSSPSLAPGNRSSAFCLYRFTNLDIPYAWSRTRGLLYLASFT